MPAGQGLPRSGQAGWMGLLAMRGLIAGNWKMNGLRGPGLELAGAVAAGAKGSAREVLLCPPFPLLALVAERLAGTGIGVGGQDCHAKVSGAHTGDVSAAMLRDVGAGYVILGHSERRADHGESDAVVRAKVEAAVVAGLSPIVCVGETLAEREGGRAVPVVERQLDGSIPETAIGAGLVIAYEPVWAIGTGKVADLEDIEGMHGMIRGWLRQRFGGMGEGVRILYGGSVKAGNAKAILAVPEVNGALVGGASLVAEEFLAIVGG